MFVFLTFEDFDPSVQEELRRILATDDVLMVCENRAVQMAKNYLRKRYNIGEIFAKTGNDRDPVLVECLANIAIYKVFSSVMPRQIPETRRDLYHEATEYLRRASLHAGSPDALFLDFPLAEEAKDNTFRGSSFNQYSNEI